MKIYTRGGDSGETSLFGGRRVAKNDARVEAYGAIDELNSTIGGVLAGDGDPWLVELLREVQRDLMGLCALLAALDDPAAARAQDKVARALEPARVEALEAAVDVATDQAPPLTSFVLPGGSARAAALHVARAVCRRAERRCVALEDPAAPAELITYLNRLSDLCFALARRENARAGIEEPCW